MSRVMESSKQPGLRIRAVFAGSFDPVTLGHMDIIERAAKFCSTLYVLVSQNAAKTGFFEAGLRAEWIRQAAAGRSLSNVEVLINDGLTAKAAVKLDASIMIRALRSGQEFDYEASMAFVNNEIEPSVQTVCLFCDPKYSMISSTNVRELLSCGCSAASLLPKEIVQSVEAAWNRQRMQHQTVQQNVQAESIRQDENSACDQQN